ncbi:hypothetical protein DENIS_4374 [Desulfonema ishimotonii]|uniref:Uncharacterized protein n=1 Tax=Desulfonema ishimotonii TaxID=45657 RepID=A0A401G2C7_9BACT|nr:hypothetical protein [Desulfonema ishimotonii]GBC63380.1 hypothetical protein DENIS_4374 [Desulfonema ishimotonii]
MAASEPSDRTIRHPDFPLVIIRDSKIYAEARAFYDFLSPSEPYPDWTDRYLGNPLLLQSGNTGPLSLIPISLALAIAARHITWQGHQAMIWFRKVGRQYRDITLDAEIHAALTGPAPGKQKGRIE